MPEKETIERAKISEATARSSRVAPTCAMRLSFASAGTLCEDVRFRGLVPGLCLVHQDRL